LDSFPSPFRQFRARQVSPNATTFRECSTFGQLPGRDNYRHIGRYLWVNALVVDAFQPSNELGSSYFLRPFVRYAHVSFVIGGEMVPPSGNEVVIAYQSPDRYFPHAFDNGVLGASPDVCQASRAAWTGVGEH
jgi:hypothetical protein